MTKFAPHKALTSTTGGKLTSDERVILYRVDRPVSPRMKRMTGKIWQALFLSFGELTFSLNGQAWNAQIRRTNEGAPPSIVASNHLVLVLDLYWRSPESGGCWYT